MRESIEKNMEQQIHYLHRNRTASFQNMQSYRGQKKLDSYLLYNQEAKNLCPNCGAMMQKSFPLTSVYFCPECLCSVEETKMNPFVIG